MTKEEVRKQMLEERAKLSPEEIHTRSLSLQEEIVNLQEFSDSNVIYIYSPIRKEPEIDRVREIAYRQNKKVCLPVIVSEYEMLFQVVQEDEILHETRLGILEPIFDLDKEMSEPGLMIIPFVAHNGNYRLGYGKGYYDRFLAVDKKITTVGVGYSFSGAEFEIDHYDVRLDHIIVC